MAGSLYQVLNNHDTFTIDKRPNDPPRAFSLEFTLELSSNFRLSDTKFQTRLVEQRYCENDILVRCIREYRELSSSTRSLAAEATLRDRLAARWMLGLSINGMEASALDISGRVSVYIYKCIYIYSIYNTRVDISKVYDTG